MVTPKGAAVVALQRLCAAVAALEPGERERFAIRCAVELARVTSSEPLTA